MSLQYREDMAPWGNADYRLPKALRFELVQHIGIFFEEKFYAGTPQGSCIARTIRGAHFEPFKKPRVRILYRMSL